MLLMTADYAQARNEKAERTKMWLIGNMRVKPFTTPQITAIDVAAADRRPRGTPKRTRAQRQAENA